MNKKDDAVMSCIGLLFSVIVLTVVSTIANSILLSLVESV